MKLSDLPLVILILSLPFDIKGCEPGYEFEGFGVNLGSVESFQGSETSRLAIESVLDKVYDDLRIRFFRTHYNQDFSLVPEVYEIPPPTQSDYYKAWDELHSQLSAYSNISLIVSISSPPDHMKNQFTHTLPQEKEQSYLDFILSINQQMEDRFDLKVERVSPINEPITGLPAVVPANKTFMNPKQLCRMIKDFNNPVVSLCPEKSFFWTSIYYANFLNGTNINRTTCIDSCDIIATHGYSWYVDFQSPSSNNFKLYYDHKQYDRRTTKPIWQTEVSSKLVMDTDKFPSEIQEALDLSINIGNFLGSMCVQRYYYYNMYTSNPSGESLIWRNQSESSPGEGEEIILRFPKKYFAFKHFSTASPTWPVNITDCSPSTFFGTFCTQFGTSRAVFTNNLEEKTPLTWHGVANCKLGSVFCTTENEDWSFSGTTENIEQSTNVTVNVVPPRSICSCELEDPKEPDEDNTSGSTRLNYYFVTNSFCLILIVTHVVSLITL